MAIFRVKSQNKKASKKNVKLGLLAEVRGGEGGLKNKKTSGGSEFLARGTLLYKSLWRPLVSQSVS